MAFLKLYFLATTYHFDQANLLLRNSVWDFKFPLSPFDVFSY